LTEAIPILSKDLKTLELKLKELIHNQSYPNFTRLSVKRQPFSFSHFFTLQMTMKQVSWTLNQERMAELLKKKGIGPQGSKSLKPEEADEVLSLFWAEDVSLTTKATMLTALLILDANDDEKIMIEKIKKHPERYLPAALFGFLDNFSADGFLSLIKKAIAKQDLSYQEATQGMDYFFDKQTPEHLQGAFLEAERLKRETFEENEAFFNSLWNRCHRIQINIPILLDICDSYDGSNRTRHFSVFVAVLLASIGYPAYVHAIDSVAPKEAVTSHQILNLAGKNVLKTLEEVRKDILSPDIGWGYLDQSIFFPQLYEKKQMRKEMVKRPFLATFEKLLQPIQANNGNHIISGYTHAHYREELVKQLKNQGECQKALILKGMEGSTHISMARETNAVIFDGNNIFETSVHPEQFGLPAESIRNDSNITAEISLNEGIEALKGKNGSARKSILYLATVILTQLQLETSIEALKKLTNSLDTGLALKHWKKGCL
jgi:anthranilate phosphoribosyltransferase